MVSPFNLKSTKFSFIKGVRAALPPFGYVLVYDFKWVKSMCIFTQKGVCVAKLRIQFSEKRAFVFYIVKIVFRQSPV